MNDPRDPRNMPGPTENEKIMIWSAMHTTFDYGLAAVGVLVLLTGVLYGIFGK